MNRTADLPFPIDHGDQETPAPSFTSNIEEYLENINLNRELGGDCSFLYYI